MKWSVLINKYNDPILDSEINLLILAWIERSGCTNEKELSKSLNIESKSLVSILLKLNRNGLIEYQRDGIILTQEGKDVIDRVGIENDIIDSLLVKFQFDHKEKHAYKNLIVTFRNSSYVDYQKALYSIYLCQHVNDFKENHNELKLNLLLYYVRDWSIYHIPSSDTFSQLNPHVKNYLTKVDLNVLNFSSYIDYERHISNKIRIYEVDERPKLTDRFAKYFKTIINKVDKTININDRYHNKKVEICYTFPNNPQYNRVIPDNHWRILSMMQISNDVDEIHRTTGIPVDNIIEVLQTIKDKCENLLDIYFDNLLENDNNK